MVDHDGHDEAAAPILVVDDDHDVLVAITEMLHEQGLPAVGAHGKREAEEVARACHPSLVLLDLHLGPDDAAELALALREECGGALPIILVTGDITPTGIDAVGAAETLTKPFHLEELLS